MRRLKTMGIGIIVCLFMVGQVSPVYCAPGGNHGQGNNGSNGNNGNNGNNGQGNNSNNLSGICEPAFKCHGIKYDRKEEG